MPRGRVVRTAARRRFAWAGGSHSGAAIATGAFSAAVLNLAIDPQTVIRIRGGLIVSLNATGIAINDTCRVGWGIMVVPSGTVAAGVAATPLSTASADWLAYGTFPLRTETGVITDVLSSQVHRVDMESKGMRKMREEQELIFVLENEDVIGAPPVDFAMSVRILFQQ